MSWVPCRNLTNFFWTHKFGLVPWLFQEHPETLTGKTGRPLGIAPRTIPTPKWGILFITLANSIAQRQKPTLTTVMGIIVILSLVLTNIIPREIIIPSCVKFRSPRVLSGFRFPESYAGSMFYVHSLIRAITPVWNSTVVCLQQFVTELVGEEVPVTKRVLSRQRGKLAILLRYWWTPI